MPEQKQQDLNVPIGEAIQAAKGVKIGDDFVNPLEKKLYDNLVTEHGIIIADMQQSMNQSFLNLIDDVGDISEENQSRLRKVAEMLGVTLLEKDGSLQMNYELFQKILKFQKKRNEKLTGIVDDTLYQALRTEKEKKTDIPATPTETEKNPTESTADNTAPIPPSLYPVEPQISEKTTLVVATRAEGRKYEGDGERILPPTLPVTPAGIVSVGVEAGANVAPIVTSTEGEKAPVETTQSATPEKPTIKALPVEEAEVKTEEVKKVISEEGEKLGITINGLEISESPLGQEIVDMILYYEGSGGSRQPDAGGYDIGGGISTGSSSEEKKYALGENYDEWNSNFIPKEHVRECVMRLLNVRIALTKKSCADKGVDFDILPQNVKAVLVDLHYNMPNNINEFTKFWTAIKEQNWQEAGKQLVDNGSGDPSGYLNQVAGRAYANALMLANRDTNYAEYKREGEKIGGGTALLNQYNQKVGQYGKKVGMGERKEIVGNAQNAGDILAQTTSTDILATRGSTKSITKILDTYIQKHPEERAALIAGLVEKIGNFSRPLQTREEIGAFQQLVYLGNPEAFTQLQFIDGEYGSKTDLIFSEKFISYDHERHKHISESMVKTRHKS